MINFCTPPVATRKKERKKGKQESDRKSGAKSKYMHPTDAHETRIIQDLDICSLSCLTWTSLLLIYLAFL